jgi:iron complex outermembrane receptor protein
VSGTIFTIDASASVAWSNYQLRFSVTNLLDTQYRLGEYNYASDFNSQAQPTLVPDRTFTAGPPRALFLTLGFNFGGA